MTTKKKDMAEETAVTKKKDGRGGYRENVLSPTDPRQFDVKPGENSAMVKKLMMLYDRPLVKTDEECEERICDYFQWCADTDTKPSVTGLASALGTNRQTMLQWERGETLAGTRRSDVIKKAKGILATFMEEMAQNGKVNPVIGIFLMKNHFGFRDQQDVVLTPGNPLGDSEDPGEIQKRLLQAVPGEEVED